MAGKVLITGMNIISSLGLDLETNWKNLAEGKSGVKRITLFDPSRNITQIAAEVPPEFEELSKQTIKKRQAGQMTRVTRMCLVCTQGAVSAAGIDFGMMNRSRVAVITGVVNTGNSSSEAGTTVQNTIFKSMTNSMPAWISLEFQLTGPAFAVNTACASSAYTIGLGYDLIRSGQADMVITGGADSIINTEEIEGFNALYALSVANDPPERACKPFSADRDGFVIGEGAGCVILESEESALSRGAAVYAEVAGYGLTSEAYNIMAPMKDGEGMAITMEKALKHAGVDPSGLGYINAHGTSTVLNDRFETLAIKKVFGDKAYQVPVSSSKSMIGHTIGAAGAIEAVITAMTVKTGLITPTLNLYHPDPELDLDYVPHKARRSEVRCAISNSFGFGGHNATLVFRKYP